jgi:glutamine amidotransferase
MIAIINAYGGNLSSVQFALDRLDKKSILTSDIQLIKKASHVILPGVCNAKEAMKQLKYTQLLDVISQLKQPVLGICLGMQILYEYSAEGKVDCLGLIPGKIQAMPLQKDYRIPHMGWNRLQLKQNKSSLLENTDDKSYVYFIHSYAASVTEHTLATVTYGAQYSAIVQHNNFFGMQFHPERSGKVGETILQNFLNQECDR